MRVTFDSNAWERIFVSEDKEYQDVRSALLENKIEGFICESAFCIEAIIKKDRSVYFSKPRMDTKVKIVPSNDGSIEMQVQIGPCDDDHPGLPEIQVEKLDRALSHGFLLLRGVNWLGLPRPAKISDQSLYITESEEQVDQRNQRQADMSAAIEQRGVGRAMFEKSGGWAANKTVRRNEKQFQQSCAEWADGEIVIAHTAYQNDILCTEDHGKSSPNSIFGIENREWLREKHGVKFATLDELRTIVSQL